MNITITITEMFQHDPTMVFHLIGMVLLLVAIAFLVNTVGNGIAIRDAQAALPAAGQADHKAGNVSEVTAAITAAVGEYRNKNK